MKYSTLFCAVIVVLTSLFASTSSAVLVDRYSFTTGTNDSVGTNHGTLVGGASVSGGQLVLPGASTDWLYLPANTLSTYTSVSVEAWFTLNVSSGWLRIFDFGDTSGNNGGYYWFYTPSGNGSRLVIATNGFPGYSTGEQVASTTALATATPYHLVCVYNAAATQMRIYQNGVQVASNDAVTMLLSDVHRTYAYVGRSVYPGDPHLNGTIDEFRIYDSVLTANQVQQNYEWGPDTIASSLVTITETDGSTTIYTGGQGTTDTYQIQLAQQPTASVVITVDPPVELNLGAGAGTAIQLTFTTSSQPQTITVAAANPQTPQELISRIQHTSASSDSNFNAINIYDVSINVLSAECGALGYLEADYNLDCSVNLQDFSLLAQVWLETDVPLDLNELAGDWLQNTMIGQPGSVEGPVKESAQPFAVNTANILHTVEENVYGQFLEHIYHSANGGLWGELIWNRSFELDSSSGGGIWSIEGSELVQSSLSTDVHMEFGDTAWTDYELTLEARKDGGNEGFLILFRSPDSNNFYWLNLGGWTNTQHAIEKEVNGSRSTVSSSFTGSITTGQWYDIRIRCEGGHFQVWLDDTSIIDYTDSSPFLTGQVGVGTWATQARFRNIQVTDLAGTTVLYSGLPSLPGTTFQVDFWNSFGGGTFTVDTDSLNDDKSVKIVATGGATGLLQDNFKFIPQAYHGSLWMKGTLPAGVSVELLDGTTVLGQATLSAPTSSWAEYPFSITPSASTTDGTLRITLLGAGTVYIDQVSMMGQDAIDTGGYRPDLLQAVSELRPPIIRWPGGCFASLYLWKDGIRPQYTRRRYSAYMWQDQDTNAFGTDEFIRMCEQIGAKPLICINTGILNSACGAPAQWKLPQGADTDYVQYALDWMEYCNGDPNTTTWGAVRAANGHPEPYNVEYWEIDNETWAAGSAAYVTAVQAFAPAMRAKAAALGVPIQISAVGGGSYDHTWNEDIIDGCATLIDYISVHHYEGSGGYKSGPDAYEDFLIWLAGYIAGSANPDMKIYNSEWNLQTTDWRTGLYAGGILNVYERQGAAFKMGGPALFLRHTSASDWDNAFINFDHTGWFAAPNYVVMKLWWDHYAPYSVETTGTDTDLNVSSVLSEDEQTLYIHVVNADPIEKSVAFDIAGSFVPQTAYMHYVAPGDLYARNTLAAPNTVHVQAKVVGIDGQTIRFLMPAYSAGVVTVTTDNPPAPKLLYSYRGQRRRPASGLQP